MTCSDHLEHPDGVVMTSVMGEGLIFGTRKRTGPARANSRRAGVFTYGLCGGLVGASPAEHQRGAGQQSHATQATQRQKVGR